MVAIYHKCRKGRRFEIRKKLKLIAVFIYIEYRLLDLRQKALMLRAEVS